MKEKCAVALVAATLVVGMVISGARASDLQDMYNEMGAFSNTTEPQMLKTQTMNIDTGGGYFLRTPVANRQFATLEFPSASAGCGGIDAHGGSFSYINTQAFTSLLKNIGSNALGLAFELALHELTSMFGDVLDNLETIERSVNNLNISSCKAAKGGFGSLLDRFENERQELDAAWGAARNVYSDIEEGHIASATPGQAGRGLQAASEDPAGADEVMTGNIVWNILSQDTALTDEQKQLYMSYVGTAIYDDGAGQWRTVEPTITSLTSLIGPGDPTLSQIQVIKCDDTIRCLHPTMPMGYAQIADPVSQTGPGASFLAMTQTALDSLLSDIQTQTQPTPADYAFMQSVALPVYRIVTVAAAVPGAEEYILDRYVNVIATDYAATYARYVLNAVEAELNTHKQDLARGTREAVDHVLTNVRAKRRDMEQVRLSAYQKVPTIESLDRQLDFMQRSITAQLSQQLRENVAFGAR